MTAPSKKADDIRSARRGRIGLWAFFLFLALLFITAGLGFGSLVGYQYNLPPIQSLEDYRPDVITSIYSDDNKVIGEFAIERRIVASFEEIPPYLQLALIAVEDAQFYHHSGLNYYSILRAVVKDTLNRSFPIGKGASTITLQLARMLTGRYEKTWDRKIKDILIAWKIEKRYSKHQILTLYANLHNMGPGIYGVAAAADYYFGKQLKDLTLEECALIAGLPRSPARYNPRTHPREALARRNLVLGRMAEERMISPGLAEETKRKPIVLAPLRRNERELAPHFVEWVRETLTSRYSTDEIWRKGMRVYTTLDLDMQNAARRALGEGLRRYDKRTGWRGPIGNAFGDAPAEAGAYAHPSWRIPPRPEDLCVGVVEEVGRTRAVVRIGDYRGEIGAADIAWTGAKSPGDILGAGDLAWFRVVSLDENKRSAALRLDQQPEVEGALVILENATGKVRALVGGYDFSASEFNRATQAMRQVGSTFKPIVYAAAFEQGLGPESPLLDTPVSYPASNGSSWNPRNYDGRFKGKITVRQALAESRNVPTVKVASMIGIKNVVVMARRFGLGGPLDPYLPLALGACEATPLEMASAFTVFPNLGNQARPWFLRRVEDYDRVVKEEHEPQVRRVLQPEHAAAMLDLLQNVVQSGTAQAARVLEWPVGGKTGTTNDFTDAWFVGFTPSLTAAVWVGYDKERNLGERQSGSSVALPIWIECMREILRDAPAEHFPAPEAAGRLSGEEGEAAPGRQRIFIEDLP